MTIHRMLRLAVFSTYLCAVSSAQTVGIGEIIAPAREVSGWIALVHGLLPLRHPDLCAAAPRVELLGPGGLAPC